MDILCLVLVGEERWASVSGAFAFLGATFIVIRRCTIRIVARNVARIVPMKESCWTRVGAALAILHAAFVLVSLSA